MKSKILISTGGSGGHVIPAITMHDHLKENYDILISSDVRGLKYLDDKFYKTLIIDTPKLNNFILLPLSILKVIFLTLKSLILLKKEEIQILISTGGYMSLPLCIAARILNIKIYLLEPNMVIGRANKFFLTFCKKIICYAENIIGFPKEYKNKLKITNPLIRKKYYNNKLIENNNEKFTLIIIGGSQGAQIFDKILHQSIIKVSKIKSLKVIHQTNQKNIGVLKNLYLENNIDSSVFSFDQNLNLLIDQADLCITRAGASSLAEISLSRKPFIAIPLPSSKDNHQLENANYYKNKGCCWVVDQINFDKIKFEDLLLNILNNKNEILLKKNNLEKLNFQNTWNNVNQNLLNIINEN
ncbi:UDP-N-acetylglucosamine--N-acetylmuramyl-(pentapeptide) pyrophosphoryl-undecaprenol N-acetylglucosamine transferase [Candidatus Pelagibacter bacterium]|nr:UDP-N-acetylglucosamine--N-acetylmuramyl-(pentapeptide) pyrophosphoryl-undecaprenol N-acetylglucosamine transferase [Candidatus Pelagibacter bacterium]MDB4217789.1 UDP-N-acetylglucosamine--N-acetylmuramyl-(pentapeptide) pyrophosphoryl-undecaprenol N-acetylglucosamine transferase [Candidatus Pelagibacter sp.]